MQPDVKDLRSVDRYILKEKLTGSFGSAPVVLIDLGEQGVQIEHTQPLRLATTGRLWFKRGEVSVSLHAFVVWSKLSGKSYRSGLRIDEPNTHFLAMMQTLALHGVIVKDDDSLNRKRKNLEAREQEKSVKPTMKVVPTEPDVSPDQVLLIQHARRRLKENFDEAQKWYSRAYFALRNTSSDPTRYPEDVLAVWEYLERSVPLAIIQRVFNQDK